MRPGFELALGITDAHLLQQLQRPLPGIVLLQFFVQDQRLTDLFLNGVQRIQRHHRLLENHADAVAAHTPQHALARAQQLFPFEADTAAWMTGAGIGQ